MRAIADGASLDGATVHGIDIDTVDVTDSSGVNAFVASIGGADILVNSAGGVRGQVGRPIEEVTDEQFRDVVESNLTGTFICVRAVVPGMKERGWGRIVNISSGAGRSVSLTGIQAYASAKAGQIGFTRQMAHELGRFGITVNCVAPGFVLSNPTSIAQWESYGEEGQAHCSRRFLPVVSAKPRTSRTACASSSVPPPHGSVVRRSRSTVVMLSTDIERAVHRRARRVRRDSERLSRRNARDRCIVRRIGSRANSPFANAYVDETGGHPLVRGEWLVATRCVDDPRVRPLRRAAHRRPR